MQPRWILPGLYPAASLVVLSRDGRNYEVMRTCCGRRYEITHSKLRKMLAESELDGLIHKCAVCTRHENLQKAPRFNSQSASEHACRGHKLRQHRLDKNDTTLKLMPAGAELPDGITPPLWPAPQLGPMSDWWPR